MLYFISSSSFAACQLMLLYVQDVTVEQSQGVTRHFQNTAVPVADAVNFVCKEYGTDNTLVDVSSDLCISGIKCENVDVNGCDTMLTFPQLRFLCEEDRQMFSHTDEAFVGSQLANDEHMSHNMYNSLCNTSTMTMRWNVVDAPRTVHSHSSASRHTTALISCVTHTK